MTPGIHTCSLYSYHGDSLLPPWALFSTDRAALKDPDLPTVFQTNELSFDTIARAYLS